MRGTPERVAQELQIESQSTRPVKKLAVLLVLESVERCHSVSTLAARGADSFVDEMVCKDRTLLAHRPPVEGGSMGYGPRRRGGGSVFELLHWAALDGRPAQRDLDGRESEGREGRGDMIERGLVVKCWWEGRKS